jgi:hypothetical protein
VETFTKTIATKILHFLTKKKFLTCEDGYSYGKTQSETSVINESEIIKKRKRVKDRRKWISTIQKAHPAFITWQTFLSNESQLLGNTMSAGGETVKREGSAILQGMVCCARCGRRMSIYYQGHNGNRPSYVCNYQKNLDITRGVCWSVPSNNIDRKG